MTWLWVLLATGGIAAYLPGAVKEFKIYSKYFYATHPMSHSSDYRFTDLYLPGVFIMLIWPLVWGGRKIKDRFCEWRYKRTGKNPASGPVR